MIFATDYSKKVVEFFASGALKLGCVMSQAKTKLQIIDQNGRNVTIAPRQVLVVHTRTAEPSTIAQTAREIEAEIDRRLAETDTELLWESVQERERAYSIPELAAVYFGEADSISSSAIFRAVSEDRVRFKMKGLEIHPRSREQVEELFHAERKRAEKEAFQQRREEWARQIFESEEPGPAPEEMRPILESVEAFLFDKADAEIEEWLAALAPDSTAKETAFALLVRTGRLPKDADPLLIIAGIDEKFPPEAEELSASLPPFVSSSSRADHSHLKAFAIDDLDTREVDDALTVEFNPQGVRVGVHIADVSHFVAPGDALHREALRRASSIYLPQRTVMMLPERLSSDLASLTPGELRPTMSFEIQFDEAGEILDWRLAPGQLAVATRLSYDEADAVLEETEAPLSEPLAALDRISAQLLERRKEKGALTIRRPELKIRAVNGEVSIKVIGDSPSRRIVSELMILANRLAAEYASSRAMAIVYRSQEPPAEGLQAPETYHPVAMDQVFRKLKKSKYTLQPQAHAGLGLPAYTQLTSPIRRLLDLVIQQQFSAHFAGAEPPHDEESLLGALAAAQAAEADIRAVERKANRYYTLAYLEQNLRKATLEAIVVAELRNGYLLETTDLFVRGRLRASPEPPQVGDPLKVTIEKVDPEEDILIFRQA